MFTPGQSGRCTVSLFIALLGIVAASPLALAAVSETILTVTATCGRSSATLMITQEGGYWDGDNFFWSIDVPMEIRDGERLLGTFGPASIAVYADPQVNLGFAVQADEEMTSFTITSALLDFPDIEHAWARADAAFTLQDWGTSGALLTGTGPGGGAYLTQYNGLVPDGTTFAEGINAIEVVPPAMLQVAEFSSAAPGEYTYIGFAGSMSSQIAFNLSPMSMASGSANFEIIPEPTAMLLILVALAAARRR